VTGAPLMQSLTWLWWLLPTYAVTAAFVAVVGLRELRRRRAR
jgi:cytochrome c-type biogenesis protein CcmH/NrfF